MQVSAVVQRLELADPWEVSHGRSTHRHSLVVRLEDGGLVGVGEAPEVVYRGWTVADYAAQLDRARSMLEAGFEGDPAGWWSAVRGALGGADALPPLLSAVDCAAHDLWGKREGEPVWRLWCDDVPAVAASSFTIGMDTLAVMQRKLREHAGWPAYKVKLGTGDAARDVAMVAALRGVTDAPLRVDANTGWSLDDLRTLPARLKALGVALIEQPLPVAAHGEADAVDAVRGCVLPVFADESCDGEADVARCAAEGFAGVNVKLAKAGGLTPARRMLRGARAAGLRTMLGCMAESSVGISAAAQLLAWVDVADLDGACLLRNDPAEGVVVGPSGVERSERAGVGARLVAG